MAACVGYPPAGLSWTSTDSTATAALQLTGRAGVDSANDTYSGVLITRWNSGRIHRITNFPGGTLYFKVLSTPGKGAVDAQCYISVHVNGSLYATVPVNDRQPVAEVYSTPTLAAGTVELWEPFIGSDGTALDGGADRHFYGSYVTHVNVPAGATMAKRTATTGIIVVGESIAEGGIANTPQLANGWGGQLRQLAQNNGWLLAFYYYSTLLGDGRTASQRGDDIVALANNMGLTTLKVLVQPRPNDYAYWPFAATHTTDVQLRDGYGAMFDRINSTFGGTFAVDVGIKLPQGSSVSGDNGSGVTLAGYWTTLAGVTSGRAFCTTYDQSAVTTLGTDYFEAPNGQVHPIQSGQNKMLTGWRARPNVNL